MCLWFSYSSCLAIHGYMMYVSRLYLYYPWLWTLAVRTSETAVVILHYWSFSYRSSDYLFSLESFYPNEMKNRLVHVYAGILTDKTTSTLRFARASALGSTRTRSLSEGRHVPKTYETFWICKRENSTGYLQYRSLLNSWKCSMADIWVGNQHVDMGFVDLHCIDSAMLLADHTMRCPCIPRYLLAHVHPPVIWLCNTLVIAGQSLVTISQYQINHASQHLHPVMQWCYKPRPLPCLCSTWRKEPGNTRVLTNPSSSN